MEKRYFKLTFLEEVVLNKSSNTEGEIHPLDFINGSCFLGIVAREYDNFNDPFLIFHSGKLRFGEATLLHNGKRTYKTPLCFFAPKTDYSYKEVYNHHLLSDDISQNKQLKQIRSGFITKDLEYLHPSYNYAQKTAYDTQKRKSKDSTMFGYTAFAARSSWVFAISFDDTINDKDKDKVIKALCGEKFIGKSKSAQYGKVKIIEFREFKEENLENPINFQTEKQQNIIVYVDSTLALFDKGMPTWIPTKENLGLKDGEIDWENSQIKTRKFSPFNAKRQCKESTRMIIEKGSVIAISRASEDDINTLKKGVGAYLSEGYGELLINPNFLDKKGSFQLNPIKLEQKGDLVSNPTNNTLAQFLQNRQTQAKDSTHLWEEVEEFVKQHKNKFQNVSKAQWGEIRMRLQFHSNDIYKKES